ncbi:MAG: sigma-70 family RNA polymerase sigma factor [Planctomycetes bacterium]|nr:sigma-70 family RNA polymerase sigma factor [Planctomycetota bacterium]
MSETAPAPSEAFIRQLTAAQHGLFAFITTLLADSNAASDVMQETNIVLCRKWQEFDARRSFDAWAAGIARFKVLEYQRAERRRTRHVVLDQDLLEVIATEAQAAEPFAPDYAAALESCLERLGKDMRKMLGERYTENQSVEAIAQARGRSTQGVTVSLFRARRSLLECIQGKLGLGGNR